MPYALPPAKNKKQQSETAAYRAYINSHPGLKPYAQQIFTSARKYGVDAVYYASLINFESGGSTTTTSKANAFGPAQIHIPTWKGKSDPRDGHTITEAEIRNPTWNIGFGAFLLKRALNNNGSYDAAYRQGYNPGYKGKGPFGDIPKAYVPIVGTASPQEAAQTSVETSTAKQALTDPYVTIKNGKLIKTDAKHAVKVFGEPLRRSQFLSTWQNLNDIYLSYTGKPVSLKQAQAVMAQGLSRYQLVNRLSNGPNFQNSQVWKQNAPGYEGVWKKLYGDNTTPDPDAVRYAIINNLGGDGFANELRKRPDYETSSEFKTQESSMAGVYTKIFGVPDSAGAQVIKTAARQGQTPDMFASYLRAAPEYKMSSEFKSRAYGLAQQLGFLTGQTPTLNESLIGGSPVGTATPGDPNAKPAGVLG